MVFNGLSKMKKSTHIIMQSFEKRMCSHLATHYCQALRSNNINIDKIDLFVKGGLEKAKAFGIANKTEMQCFLEYLAINGVDKNLPKKKPWLHTLLRRDDLSQLRKIREIKIKASTHNYN